MVPLRRFFQVVSVVILLAVWSNGSWGIAQQSYEMPDALIQIENLPAVQPSCFHLSARFRSDGYLYIWDGTYVWRQNGVNVDGFTPIGQVTDGAGVNMADAGPFHFSPDDQKILIGNGAGGWGPFLYPPQEQHAGRLFSMTTI